MTQTQPQTLTQPHTTPNLPPLRDGPLPDAMRTLLQDYPRDSWDAHPGFRDKTRHWMGAHQMFRRLAAQVQRDTEETLDGARDTQDFAARLAYYGGALVANLHGHHGWEDRVYFPELAAAEPRFAPGLDVLEADHATLDRVLSDFTRTANRAVQLAQLDPAQVPGEAGVLHPLTEGITAFLDRHLADEEDLAVPIILHHRLRG